MKKELSSQISKNIKKYRLLNNMTQEDMANELELDTQYYAQLERGERNFTIEKLVRICSIFHIGIEDIIHIPKCPEYPDEYLLKKITKQLSDLSESQLLIIEKFIQEIVPFIK